MCWKVFVACLRILILFAGLTGSLWDFAELVSELSAKLISGHTDGLTLTPKQQDHFLNAYFLQLMEDHGPSGPENYLNIACRRAKSRIRRVTRQSGK
jgi:hypothetical protein